MNINYKATNGVLIKGVYKSEPFIINFSDIAPFWEYATEDDFEGGKAKIYDNYLVASILTAEGQGGLIFVWDLEQSKVVSCFEGDFCIDFTANCNTIYSLHYVSQWGMTSRFELRKSNIEAQKQEDLFIEIPFNDSVYNGNMEDVSMAFSEDKTLSITFGDNVYVLEL